MVFRIMTRRRKVRSRHVVEKARERKQKTGPPRTESRWENLLGSECIPAGRRGLSEQPLQFLLFSDFAGTLNDFFCPVIVLSIELVHIKAKDFSIGNDHGFIVDMQ